MKKLNIKTENFVEITLFEHPALFTENRLDRETLPTGLFMYDIRHGDDSSPASIEKKVHVNYYGAVILPDPLALNSDGYLDVDAERDMGGGFIEGETVIDFQEKYGMEPMKVYPARFDERNLFYRANEPSPYSCIGYLRGDFGKGNEFWHTWFDNREDLKGPDFIKEFDEIVALLRKKGYLKNLSSMSALCRADSIIASVRPFYGFKIRTQHYRYYIRCSLQKGDYNFYVMCYLNEIQQKEKENNHEK